MNAVVTGLGVVSPLGTSTRDHWAAVLDGRCGLAATQSFDSERLGNPVSGEVDFDASTLPSRLVPATDRMTQMSLVASDEALVDSGLEPTEPELDGIGVVTAATAGGYAFGQRELQNLWSKGPKYISTHQSYAWFYAVNTGQISIRNGFRGHSSVVVADDAGGLDAISTAARRLRRENRAVVSGAVDSAMCPWGRVAQTSAGDTSPVADPATAFLPFDAAASGRVHAEGGAHLVLQDGAEAGYGVVLGHGASIDGPDEPAHQGLVTAIRTALAQAGLAPAGVDVVFADAAGVRDRDRSEAAAITEVFGASSVPVTAPKAATGRLGSGTGPLDVAMALMALADQVVPPTVNVTPDDALGLDLRSEARRARLTTALVLSRGTGGFNSALIVGA